MSVFLSGGLVLSNNGVGQVDDVSVLVLFDHMKSLASAGNHKGEYLRLLRADASNTHVCMTSAGVMQVLLAISSILISSLVSNNVPTMTSAQ